MPGETGGEIPAPIVKPAVTIPEGALPHQVLPEAIHPEGHPPITLEDTVRQSASSLESVKPPPNIPPVDRSEVRVVESEVIEPASATETLKRREGSSLLPGEPGRISEAESGVSRTSTEGGAVETKSPGTEIDIDALMRLPHQERLRALLDLNLPLEKGAALIGRLGLSFEGGAVGDLAPSGNRSEYTIHDERVLTDRRVQRWLTLDLSDQATRDRLATGNHLEQVEALQQREMDLRGLRLAVDVESYERLYPEEFERLPSREEVFEAMVDFYHIPPQERFLRRHVLRFNKNVAKFLKYVINPSDSDELVPIEDSLLQLGRRYSSASGNQGVRAAGERLVTGDFNGNQPLVEAILDTEAQARGMKPFPTLEQEREALKVNILAPGPNGARTEITEAFLSYTNQNPVGRLDELRFLRDKLAADDPRRALIDDMVAEYDSHPVYSELQPIIEQRRAVIAGLAEEAIKPRDSVKKEKIDVPERAFGEALKITQDSELMERVAAAEARLKAKGIDPEMIVDQETEADLNLCRYYESAKREVEAYYAISEEIGLLQILHGSSNREFREMRIGIAQESIDQEERLFYFGERLAFEENYTSHERRVWAVYGQRLLTSQIRQKFPGISQEKLNGIVAYVKRSAEEQYFEHLLPPQTRTERKLFNGEWSAEEIIEAEKNRGSAGLWRIATTGIYEVLVEEPNPRKFTEAGESFGTSVLKSGVVEREPGTIMQKAQYFSEAMISKAVDVAARTWPGDSDEAKLERAKFIDQVAEARRAFMVEIYAYCGEIFGHTFNTPNLAAMVLRLFNSIDGVDQLKTATELRDGEVFGVYLTQCDPEFELMWRIMGPHNQVGRNYDAQLWIYSLMRERLAEKRVGEVLWDRHEKFINGTSAGWIIGENAKRANLDLLGTDRSREEIAARAYVPTTTVLLGHVRGQLEGGAIITQQDLEKNCTPAELTALRLRDLKARRRRESQIAELARMGGIKIEKLSAEKIKQYEDRLGRKLWKQEDILPFNQNRYCLSKVENNAYDVALMHSRESVNIYMQLSSMFGDVARETSPSYICKATDANGVKVDWLRAAVELDKVPKWRLERLSLFTLNMALRTISQHNAKLIASDSEAYKTYKTKKREAAKLKKEAQTEPKPELRKQKLQQAELKEKESPYIARGGVRFKEIMGIDPTDKDEEGGTYIGLDFQKEAGFVLYSTVKQLSEEGWGIKIMELEIDDKGDHKMSETKRLKVPGSVTGAGPEGQKDADLFTVAEHPFALRMDKSYVVHQIDQRKKAGSKELHRLAEAFLRAEISADEAGSLVLELLTLDPPLDRVVAVPGSEAEEIRVMGAACEQSYLYGSDVLRALGRWFRGFIAWDYTSLMSTGPRRLQHASDFADCFSDRVMPRAEFNAPFISTDVRSVGDAFAKPHSFEVVRLAKRYKRSQEKISQQALDGPVLEDVAGMYTNGGEVWGSWMGKVKSDGTLDPGVGKKPTAAAENLMHDELPGQKLLKQMTNTQLREAKLPPGTHAEIFQKREDALNYLKKIQAVTDRERGNFDNNYAMISKNHAAEGFVDARQEELFEYAAVVETIDQAGNPIYRLEIANTDGKSIFSDGGIPAFEWDINDRSTAKGGQKRSKNTGRGRHKVAVDARAFFNYLGRFRMPDERGRKVNGQLFSYNGGATEYEAQGYDLRHLNSYLPVKYLEQEDRDLVGELWGERPYVTVAEFLVAKYCQR